MAVKVKVCGITNLEDAKASVDAGCDALGFVFYKTSPRYITPIKASEIIKKLPSKPIKIGVFVNSSEDKIKHIAKLCGLDILQFHGNESSEFCQRFKGYKVIKAFRIKNGSELEDISRYKTFAYLFDTFSASQMGGTGKKFDWKLIRHLNNLKEPIFLSGGLNAQNVKAAIRTVQPEWLDVSSSLEIKPGRKDHKKVKEFIRIAKTDE